MPQLLRAFDNRNAPLVEPGKGALVLSYSFGVGAQL